MNIKEKFWIGTFISLWVLVSTVSTFHSVEFFGLSNNLFFSWCIAIGFEIGAMASLGGLLISKGNKTIVWILFVILTAFQIHGNMYWAWSHAGDISGWISLFGLGEEEPDFQKRIFSFISGGILPLISLGFIKSLMDYMRPDDAESDATNEVVNDATIVDENKQVLSSLMKEYKEEQEGEIKLGATGIEIPTGIWDKSLSEPRKFERVPEEVIDDFLKPGEIFESGKQVDKQIDNNPLPPELNKTKDVPNKLSELIDNAESQVNSIGEK